MERDRKPAGWLIQALPLALLAGGIHLLFFFLYRHKDVWWKSWEHPAGASWHWVPFIHPPLFTEYMRAFERWSDRTGWPEGELLMLVAAALVVPVVLLCARLTHDGPGRGRWVALACGLLAISPAGLRPFEQYPLAVLLLTLSLVALLVWWRHGGSVLWLVVLGLTLLTVEFHLSSWFVLAPMAAMLWLARRERRRGVGVLMVVVLALFLASTQGWLQGNSLADVFEQPGVRARDIFSERSWRNPTFEFSNPLLYLPLLLWFVPSIRRVEPRGAAIAAGLAIYVVVHLLLMQQGLAIHAQAPEPHHYFEMIDPVATACSVWALAAAWQTWPEAKPRRAIGVVVGLLVVSQLAVGAWAVHRLVQAAPLW
jgi:hypothetical protein